MSSCVRVVLCLAANTDERARRAVAARERSAIDRLRRASALLLRTAEHARNRIGHLEHELYALQVERRAAALRARSTARVRALRADEVARARRLLDERRTATASAVRAEQHAMMIARTINELASASLQREVVESLRDGSALASDAVRRLADAVDIDALVDEMAESRDVAARIDEALASMADADALAVDDAAVARELERLECDGALAERVGEPRVDDAAAAALEADARELAAATAPAVRARVALADECA